MERYKRVGVKDSYDDEGNCGSAQGILKVVKYRKGPKAIDVVLSCGRSALLPILHFDFTIPMNAMSPNQFICFYPLYTLNKKGVFSGSALERARDGIGIRGITERAITAANKYVERGFSLMESSHVVVGEAMQETSDVEMLVVKFGRNSMISSQERKIRWCIGGYHSQGTFFVQEI